MYFIEGLTAHISKDFRRTKEEGDYYFARRNIQKWAEPWLGHFSPALFDDGYGRQRRLGQLAQAFADEFQTNKRRFGRLAFLLEMAALNVKPKYVEDEGDTPCPSLTGHLSFLLSIDAQVETRKPLVHSSQATKDANRYVDEALADSYFRLLAAFWNSLHPRLNLPDADGFIASLPQLDDQVAQRLHCYYEKKQGAIERAIRDIAQNPDADFSKATSRFGLAKKKLTLDLARFKPVDKLFFRRRRYDPADWYRSYRQGLRPAAADDPSAVFQYYETDERKFLTSEKTKFPVTLLLILAMEAQISASAHQPFPPAGNVPATAAMTKTPNAMMARNRIDGAFASPGQANQYARHITQANAGITMGRASRRFAPPSASGTLSHDAAAAITTTAQEFPIWHNDGTGRVWLIDQEVVLKGGEDDDYEECRLPARSAIAVRISRTDWEQADFAVQTFVQWVRQVEGEGWLRFYLPHTQYASAVDDSGQDIVMYLYLDEDCIALAGRCEPPLYLGALTTITAGVEVTQGLLQVFVMIT